MTKTLVVGATSSVGRDVVTRLLATSHAVRVVVRKDADAAEFAGLGAEVARGDVRDGPALDAACEGMDTIVSLFGRHFAESEQQLWDVDARGNELLAESARRAGATHFVLLSILWADRDVGPVVLRVKRRAEDAVIASGISYAILRPSTFVEGPSSLLGSVGPTIERWGVAMLPSPDSLPVSFVAVADLAEALANAALAGPGKPRVLEIGGPRAITFREGAEMVGNTLGKRVRFVRAPKRLMSWAREFSKTRGFGRYEAVLFFEMLRDHGYACSPDGLRELLGREPTRVEDAIEAHYARAPKTAWRDSIYGSFSLRSR